MKKDTLLLFVALATILLTLRTIMAREEVRSVVQDEEAEETECCPPPAVDCRECCHHGRWVTDECARACNQCELYSDIGSAEARDFP